MLVPILLISATFAEGFINPAPLTSSGLRPLSTQSGQPGLGALGAGGLWGGRGLRRRGDLELRSQGVRGLRAREFKTASPPEDWELPEDLKVSPVKLPKIRKVGNTWISQSSFLGNPVVLPGLDSDRSRVNQFVNDFVDSTKSDGNEAGGHRPSGPEAYQRPDPETSETAAPSETNQDAGSEAGAGSRAGGGTGAKGAQGVEIMVKVQGDPEEVLDRLRSMGLQASVVKETEEDKAAPPYFKTSLRQLIWRRSTVLAALMALQSISSDILSKYAGLIEQNVFIALFLTMLTGTGGNAGNQSSALVIRGLSTGEINDKNAWQVVLREMLASGVIGAILGTVAFFRVIGTNGCSLTAAIIVSASTVAVVMAAIVGGTLVPLILDKLGVDPAHISSPVLATITDVSGVVLLCTVTSALLGTLQ